MTENKAFTARVIAKLQHLAIGTTFPNALNEYLVKHGRILWDDDRALFWVDHPSDGMQVAVWLMPVAATLEPEGAKP